MTTHRKLAGILAADAASHSQLMGNDEAATLRALNDARALFRERVEAHGGRKHTADSGSATIRFV